MKKFHKEQHRDLFESVVFIIYRKTPPLINKQTRFITSVMHRLWTFLSQSISWEQRRRSFCHELLIQEHRVVALCKTYTRLKKTTNKQTKKGNKGGRISLVLHETNCFPHRKKMNIRTWCSPNSRDDLPGVKSHVPLWAVYLPCHCPSSILTNIKFFTSVRFWTNQRALKLGIPHQMGRKQCLWLFRFPLAIKNGKENEHFALDLTQRWEPPPHSHHRELVCRWMLSCWIKAIHLMG